MKLPPIFSWFLYESKSVQMCIFNNPLVVQIDIIPVYISCNALNAARAGILPHVKVIAEVGLLHIVGQPQGELGQLGHVKV